MEAFDKRNATEKRGRAPEVDEEGWTLVKGTNKRRINLEQKEVARDKRKDKKRQLLHFYRHQERQEKQDKLAELRRKFEQDKAKLAAMKEKREFKPF